jgi:hypothetical protein
MMDLQEERPRSRGRAVQKKKKTGAVRVLLEIQNTVAGLNFLTLPIF